jgi:hypothetical protein
MTSGAFVDPEAITQVAAALVRYAEAERDAIARADVALRRSSTEVSSAHAARQAELDRATAALSACHRAEGRDCSALAMEVSRARERLDRARQARSIIQQAEAQFAVRKTRQAAAVDAIVTSARARLGRNAADLATFLGSPTGAGGPMTGTGGGPPGTTGATGGALGGSSSERVPSGFPPGFAMVRLSDIDDGGDAVTNRSEFGKGYSPEDLRWAHEAFHDVVLPALALGKGMDYFRERDSREGLMGTRSYADTFAGFLNAGRPGRGDEVALSRTGGGFHVDNGRHRIAVARAMGLSEIPARIL